MSLTNIQDSMVKSHLVQQVQARGEELARSQDRVQVPFSQELARQADEVVLNITRPEQDGVRDDEQLKDREERKRKEEEEREERRKKEAAPPPDNDDEASARPVGSRRIDTFA